MFNTYIEKVVARTIIVNINGRVLYDTYTDFSSIGIYWTSNYYSGIPQEFYNYLSPRYHMIGRTRIDDTMFKDIKYIRNVIYHSKKIFVGHGLIDSDFPAMGIKIINDHDEEPDDFILINNIRDTSIYYANWIEGRFPLQRRPLKKLIKQYLNINIQVKGVPHDPAEDARAALALYLLNRNRYEHLFNNNIEHPNSLQDPHYDVAKLREIIQKFPSAINKIMIYIAALQSAPLMAHMVAGPATAVNEGAAAVGSAEVVVDASQPPVGHAAAAKAKYIKYKIKYMQLKALFN